MTLEANLEVVKKQLIILQVIDIVFIIGKLFSTIYYCDAIIGSWRHERVLPGAKAARARSSPTAGKPCIAVLVVATVGVLSMMCSFLLFA